VVFLGNKIISLSILVFSLFLALALFGCTSVPVCGNNVCEANETDLSCPSDCAIPAEVISKMAWKNAQPWALTDWVKDGNVLNVVIKNNTSELLVLRAFQANSEDYILAMNTEVSPGAVVGLQIPSMTDCVSGEKYNYSKTLIAITYDTSVIQNKVEYGVADIIGYCS